MNSNKTKRKVNIRRFLSKNVIKPTTRKRLQVTSGPKAVTQTKPLSAASTHKYQLQTCQTNIQVGSNERHHATESYPDAEIDQILSEIMCPSPPSLEEQVIVGEYPYSPYSDCSDGSEWFDLAYPSPSCCSNAANLTPPQMDVCKQVSQRSPACAAYPCNPVIDQGPPTTPTIFQVLESFGW